MPEESVRVANHRLRQRYGTILREEVEATVGEGADAAAELRYLAGLLGEAGL